MCKISVAMTTYNGEKYLVKQLESLRNQSRMIDEVIICDDGSEDNTVSIIKDFINKYSLVNWSLTCNSNNLGFIGNFKKAISLTTGDIIFLCDQDDIWESSKVQTMEDVFNKNLDVQVLSCSLELIDQNDDLFSMKKAPYWLNRLQSFPENQITEINALEIADINFTPGCTMAFSRKIADQYISGDYNAEIPHDWVLNLLAAKEHGLYNISVPLIKYRVHNNNELGVRKNKPSNFEELISRLSLKKERYEICLNSDNCAKIRKNIEYIGSRISYYEHRTPMSLLKVLCYSGKIMGTGIMKNNIKDVCALLGIII